MNPIFGILYNQIILDFENYFIEILKWLWKKHYECKRKRDLFRRRPRRLWINMEAFPSITFLPCNASFHFWD